VTADDSGVVSAPTPDSEAAVDYWTPERTAEARPALPVLPGPACGSDDAGAPGGDALEVPGARPDEPTEG
jgi:hypothetical protein